MSKQHVANTADATAASPARPQRSVWPVVGVLVACLAPVILAVVLYLNPQWLEGTGTNYGTILEPQTPMPDAEALRLTDLDGQPFDLQQLRGQWLMLTADGAACPESCARKLFIMRQTHASTGKNVVRVERVWFVTDDAPVPEIVQEAYLGTHMLRVSPEQLRAFLGHDQPANHIWVIDPLGNLMMRFPEEADPSKLRKDLGKLLFASQIG